MAYYDHFTQSDVGTVTPTGAWLVRRESEWFLRFLSRVYGKSLTGTSLLELGPGRGIFAEACLRTGVSYEAVEPNEILARDLSARGFRVHRAMVPPLPGSRTYDIIFLNQLFEHMENRSQAVALVDSCREHLVPGGLVCISSPDINAFRSEFWQDYTHNVPTSRRVIEGILLDNGFTLLAAEYNTHHLTGYIRTRIIGYLARLGYGVGVFRILFGKRAYKVLLSLLPSITVIGKKKEHHGST